MAPAKKSRSVNNRFFPTTEMSHSKDGNGDNLKKSLQRKRKLSDMLGPEWSEEDLTRFYKAYRKYGKDWKKVASAVKPRTAEMVEALYTMNRAYLSLPEGTASVVGLIAMMTDHYCNLAASDSEQESNEDAGTSRKPQKRARVKIQPNVSKTSEAASPTLAATHGCLTLLKNKRSGGSRPRAVGKRTPRFPVSFSYENPVDEKYFSPSRQGLKLQADDTDDDMKIALVLTGTSQRGGSPQVSGTLNRWTDSAMSSPIETAERKRVKIGTGNGKLLGNEVDEEEGSMEADTGELLRYKNDLADAGTIRRTAQKGRRPYGEKLEVDGSGNNHFDDIKAACSGTEEGQRLGAVRGKLEMEASDEKNSRTSLQGPRKRTKNVLLRREEDSCFDALQTLADLSLMMPTTENEDESMVQVKDQIDDHVDESGSLEAVPANKQRDKCGSAGVRSRWSQPSSKFGVTSSKTSKHSKMRSSDVSAVPEKKQVRRAHKATSSKARKAEGHITTGVTDSQEAEAKELSKKSTNKGKRSDQSVSPKLIKDQEHSSCADPRTEQSDSAQSTAQVPVGNQVKLPTKVRSRRKMDLRKPQRQKNLKIPDKSLDDISASVTALHDRAFSLKEKISNCLSKHQVRSWCIYEWFYSAIDYPWFAKREFVEYLYHVGLGHVPRLTRVEWGVIRSSLGKPRRFSAQFLDEEKEKLNQYRESVRKHYSELREGTREGLPADLARPLSVGQRVIAIHPKTREIHDGSVLTVDLSRCRVQFDRPELGVEFVMVSNIKRMDQQGFEHFASHQGNVEIDFDATRFVSRDCENRYLSDFMDKKLLLERGIDMQKVEDCLPDFYQRLYQIGWHCFIETPCKVNAHWVREFYGNLKEVKFTEPDPTIIIRETAVKLNAEVLNAHYQLPDHPVELMKAKEDCGHANWLVSKLVAEGNRDKITWTHEKTSIQNSYFTAEAKRWQAIIVRRVSPSSNTTDCTYTQALMIACILDGIPVNVGAQVIQEWRDYLRLGGSSLMFPSLITALCQDAGVPIRDTDDWIDPEEPIHPMKFREEGSVLKSKKTKIDVSVTRSDRDDFLHSQSQRPTESISSQLQIIRDLLSGIARPTEVGPSRAGPSMSSADTFTREEIQKELKELNASLSSLVTAYTSMAKAYHELQVEFEKEKKKRRSRGKLLVRIWRGIKGIIQTLNLKDKILVEDTDDDESYSFLSDDEGGPDGKGSSIEFEDEAQSASHQD